MGSKSKKKKKQEEAKKARAAAATVPAPVKLVPLGGAWDVLVDFISHELTPKQSVSSLKSKMKPVDPSAGLFFVRKLESLLPSLETLLPTKLAPFTYIYLTMYNNADAIIDEHSPKVGKALWIQWICAIEDFAGDKESIWKSCDSSMAKDLPDMLKSSVEVMMNHKEYLPEHLALFYVLSFFASSSQAGRITYANFDSTKSMVSKFPVMSNQPWAEDVVSVLPIDRFQLALARMHKDLHGDYRKGNNMHTLELLVMTIGRCESQKVAAANAPKPKSYAEIAAPSHVSISTLHSSSSAPSPSPSTASTIWFRELSTGEWSAFMPPANNALNTALHNKLSTLTYKVDDKLLVFKDLDTENPFCCEEKDALTRSRLKKEVAVELIADITDAADVAGDEEEEDDLKPFLVAPIGSAIVRFRNIFQAVAANGPTPPSEDIIKLLAKAVPTILEHASYVDSLDYINWISQLSDAGTEKELTLHSGKLRILMNPLVSELLKSPNVTLFPQVYFHLTSGPHGNFWRTHLHKFTSEVGGTQSAESLARMPPELLTAMKSLLTPADASPQIIELFIHDTVPEKLALISRSPQLRVYPDYLPNALLSAFVAFEPILSNVAWLEDMSRPNEYEMLLDQSFTALRTCTNPRLHAIHLLIDRHKDAVYPLQIAFLSMLAKRALKNVAVNVSHPSFASQFGIALSEADPSYHGHVRPGITSLLYCSHLLDFLQAFIVWKPLDDGNYHFSVSRLLQFNLPKLVPFLEWIDATLLCELLSKSENLRTKLLHPFKLRYELFKGAVFGHFQRVIALEVTRPELESISVAINERYRLTELLKFLKFDFDAVAEKASDARVYIADITDLIEMIAAFKSWFDTVRVTFTLPPIAQADIDKKPVAELAHIAQSFRDQLRDAGITQDLQAQLKSCLVPQRSEIFHLVFVEAKKDRGTIPLNELPTLIIMACTHLQSMFSDASPLSRLKKLWTLIEKLGLTRLEKELVQLKEIVQSSKSQIRIEEIKMNLESGAKLDVYAKVLPGFVRFCEELPSLALEIHNLKLVHAANSTTKLVDEVHLCNQTLVTRETLQVKDIRATLQSVSKAVCQLPPHVLNFFSLIPKYDQLARFCQRPDFHNKVGILTGQIQGMQFANDLLSNLVDVHSMLSPLYTEKDLPALLQAVKDRIGGLTREQLEIKLSKFETCRSNFSEIMTYFSGNVGDSAVAFLPTAIRALKHGRYRTNALTSSDSVDIALEQVNDETGEVESTLQHHNLHGRLRSMTVFVDRSALKQEENDALDQFKSCYDLALQIAALYKQLTSSGHPAFQSPNLLIGTGNHDMTVQAYEAAMESLKSASIAWENQIADACSKTRRLVLLTPKTTSSLLHALHRLFKTRAMRNTIYEELAPYLALAFPELCYATSGVLRIPPKLIVEAFLVEPLPAIADYDFEVENPGKEALNVLFAAILDHCASMLSRLEDEPDVAEAIENAGLSNPGEPIVIRAGGLTQIELWKTVIKTLTTVPHPSQLLYGSRFVTSQDLDRFLRCAELFPYIGFVIYGVNELSHEVRHRLLNWTSSGSSSTGECGQLILLFTTDRSGEDMFGFLHSEAADRRVFEIPQRPHDVLAARGIAALHCLHSEQGKSTKSHAYFKAQNIKKAVQISISEEFEVASVIKQLEDYLFAQTSRHSVIGVHLDIKPYADLAMVTRFLNDWLYFGIIRDPSTGVAHYSFPRQASNFDVGEEELEAQPPVGFTWHFVVELTNPAPEDEGFLHLVPSEKSSIPPILEHLQSVYHLRSSEALPTSTIVITSEMRLLAALLRSYAAEKFACDETMGAALRDAEVIQIFEQQWSHLRSLRQRFAIVKRLSSVVANFCRWNAFMKSPYSNMVYYDYQHNKQTQESEDWLRKINGGRAVFGMLLAEAEYLTSMIEDAAPVPLIITRPVGTVSQIDHRIYLDAYQDEMDPLMPGTDWYAISFGPPDQELVNRCPLPIRFLNSEQATQNALEKLLRLEASEPNKEFDSSVLEIEARRELRQQMRTMVADAMGISNTGKMIRMLEQHKYVLTPNLSHKMMQLNARVGSGSNVILVGDTGQGKTEMVNFFSLFLNMDNGSIPDLLEELARLACDFIGHMYSRPIPRLPKSLSEKQKTRAELLRLFQDIALAEPPVELPPPLPVAASSAAPNLELSQATLIAVGAAPALAPAAPKYVPNARKFPDLTQAEEYGLLDSCWNDLRATLKTWLKRMFKEYPLLEHNVLLQQIEQGSLRDLEEDDEYEDGDDDDDDDDDDGRREMSVRDLERYLSAIMDLRIKNLFFKQLIYRGLPLEALTAEIRKAIRAAQDYPQLKVLFFLDESNTTAYMGRLKELIVDHRWGNKPLPSNISIVAAINPQKIVRTGGDPSDPMMQVDFAQNNAIANVVSNSSRFDVRLQHPSMEELVYYFKEMDQSADDEFWEAMIELGDTDISASEQRTVIEYVLLGQQQIRNAKIENMHPSIRDLVRAMRLFKYFRRSTFGSILLGEASMDNSNPKDLTIPHELNPAPFSAHFWKALFMTLAVGYYLRLRNEPPAPGQKPHPSTRLSLLQAINSKYEQDRGHRRDEVAFKPTLDMALVFLFANTEIPPAIAPTSALMENLFCTVICVDMKMPLTISGPAGCSKTLSFTVAVANMQGRGSPKPLYRFCAQMHHFRYQCSEMSTDAEIDATYSEATSRQLGIASADGTDIREMCTVLLDELNLAEKGSSQPLKVIHGKLDNPQVMTVILTNKLLDPAKTNRTLQVLQSTATSDDLSKLARSCLFTQEGQHELLTTPYKDAIVEGTQKAFLSLSNGSWNAYARDPSRPHHEALCRLECFQLRSFVYFLRSLRSSCLDRTGQFDLTPEKLLKAILRNFGGQMRLSDTERLVEFVFSEINSRLKKLDGKVLHIPKIPHTPINILQDSIADVIPMHEMNPNINSCRYILMLDPTDSCTSLDLLFDLGVVQRDHSVIISCPEFEEDSSEKGINERVMRFKDAMEKGETVILVAADGIFGNFYDLFNKHFLAVPVDNPKEGESPVAFFSNVAVGSISRPCKVHPNFKVIVHLPMSRVRDTPLPFLSRFEIYVLSIDHYLEEKKEHYGLKEIAEGESQLDALIGGLNHFWNTLRQNLPGEHPLHGMVDEQTIFSLAMSALESSAHGSILDPVLIPHFIRAGAIDDSPVPPTRNEYHASWVQHLISVTSFRLLQVARPEMVTRMDFLPVEYLREYFLRQEHMSAANLVRQLISFAHPRRPEPSLKKSRKSIIPAEPQADAPISAATAVSAATSSAAPASPRVKKSLDIADEDYANPLRIPVDTSLDTFQFCRKWVISTRSSGPLVRLHMDTAVQSSLVEESEMDEAMFLSASSIASIAQFNKYLLEFIETEKTILIVTADMRNRSASQINDLRREVDNHLRSASTGSSRPVQIFFILHHPPEHAQSPHYAYPAIFWNKWDFYYTDSLGVWTSEEDDSDPLGPNTADVQTIARVDARDWVAKSVGLDVQVSPESVQALFRGLFQVEFGAILNRQTIRPIEGLSSKGLAKEVYFIYLNATKRKAAMINLFEESPALINAILTQFANYWSNSLLHKIVESTCTDIRDGKATGGFIQLIRNSLRFMLISVCKNLLTAILSNLNMQPIFKMLEEAKYEATKDLANAKEEFVQAALKLVPAPSLETIIAASQLEDHEFGHTGGAVWYIPPGKCVVTTLPLFDTVVRNISASIVSAMRVSGVSNIALDLEVFIPAFQDELDQSQSLKDALMLIDSSRLLRDAFYDDFVLYQLELPSLTDSLRHIVRVIVNAQVSNLERKGIQITAAALFLIPVEFRHVLSHVGLCLAPLSILDPNMAEVEAFGNQYGDAVQNWDPEMVESKVHAFSIGLLWEHLRSATTSEFLDEIKIWRWFEAFRDLHIRITNARWLKACSSDATILSQYHRMNLLFESIRAFLLSPQELLEFVKLDRARDELDDETKVLASSLHSIRDVLCLIRYVSDTVAAVRAIDLNPEGEPSAALLALGAASDHLAQSIVESSIAIDFKVHESPFSAPNLVENISLFMHLAADAVPLDRRITFPAEILRHFGTQWCLGQLLGLMSKVSEDPAWQESLYSVSNIALRQSFDTDSTKYSLFVPFLTSGLEALATLPAGTRLPTLAKRSPHKRPHNPLELIWFQTFLKDEKETSWVELKADYDSLAGGNKTDAVRRVALATSLIMRLADALSSADAFADASRFWLDAKTLDWIKKRLLSQTHSEDDLLHYGLPADALSFLFSQFKSMDAIMWFLAQKPLLIAMGLEEWHQPLPNGGPIDSRHFRWMNLNEPADPRYTIFTVLHDHLRADPNGADTLLAAIRRFTHPTRQGAAPDAPLENVPITEAERTTTILNVRMVLFMIVFQKFMARGHACPVVQKHFVANSALTQLLDLTELELRAFQFIAGGPRVNVHEHAEVENHFSQAEFTRLGSRFDFEAQLLVNNMAATLGMPRNSNHMNLLAFEGLSLTRYTAMVASSFRAHADCGFISDLDKVLTDTNPPIMGNVARHRLALNSSYWCAYTWSLLLDGDRVAPHAMTPAVHVLNFVPLKTKEGATNYSFERATRYTLALSGEHPANATQSAAQKMLDPLLYTTECLTRMQFILCEPDRDPRWKDRVVGLEEINNYHEVAQREVYNIVDAQLEPRAQTYLDIAAASDTKLRFLVELRSRPTLIFGVAAPTANTINLWLSLERAKTADGPQRRILDFVSAYLSSRQALAATRLLPSFVRYYESLSSVVDGRFTLEELQTFSLKDALEALQSRKLESPEALNQLDQLTTAFIAHSKMFKALVPMLEGCEEGMRNRMFEFEVSEMTLETPLCSFLTINLGEGFEDSPTDRLRTMIKRLVDLHNALLFARLQLTAEEFEEVEQHDAWNIHENLYKKDDKESVALAGLRYHATSGLNAEQNFALITGDVTLLPDAEARIQAARVDYDAKTILQSLACPTIYATITSLVMSESGAPAGVMAACHVDWRRVAERIATTYTGGRHILLSLPETIITEVIPGRAEALAARAKDAVRYINLDYVSELAKIADDFRAVFPNTVQHLDNRHKFKLLRLQIAELQAMCRHVYSLIASFLQRNAPKASAQPREGPSAYEEELDCSLSALEKKANLHPSENPYRDAVFELSGRYLFHFALYLVESYTEYRFWYCEAERSPFETDFDADAIAFIKTTVLESLDLIAFELYSDEEGLAELDSEKRLVLLEQLSEALNRLSIDLAHNNVLKHAKSLPVTAPLMKLAMSAANNAAQELLKRIVPPTANVSHFTTYLRKLKIIADETTKKLHEIRTSEQSLDPTSKIGFKTYQVLVPDHFLERQEQAKNEYLRVHSDVVHFEAVDAEPTQLEQLFADLKQQAQNEDLSKQTSAASAMADEMDIFAKLAMKPEPLREEDMFRMDAPPKLVAEPEPAVAPVAAPSAPSTPSTPSTPASFLPFSRFSPQTTPIGSPDPSVLAAKPLPVQSPISLSQSYASPLSTPSSTSIAAATASSTSGTASPSSLSLSSSSLSSSTHVPLSQSLASSQALDPVMAAAKPILDAWRKEMQADNLKEFASKSLNRSSSASKFQRASTMLLSDSMVDICNKESESTRLDTDGKRSNQLHIALRLGHATLCSSLVQSHMAAETLKAISSQESAAMPQEAYKTPARLAIALIAFASERLPFTPEGRDLLWDLIFRLNLWPIIMAGQDELVLTIWRELCANQFLPQEGFETWAFSDAAETLYNEFDPDGNISWP